MDLDLNGRSALVTGSSSGIGECIARMLAEEGCRVIVHGRDKARAEQVATAIGAAGVAVGSLSDDEGATAVYEQAVAQLGRGIQILINNAGGNSSGNSSKAPLAIAATDFEANYNANTLSAVRLANHAVPAMVAGGWGRVINVSSAVAVQPNNMGSDYSAAKAALNNYTVSLAGSLKNTGVTANTITPGIIMVDGMIRWGRSRYGDDALSIEEITRRMAEDGIFDLPPAGRLGQPEEVALVACMLASPRLGYVTGANYRVDGGQIRSV